MDNEVKQLGIMGVVVSITKDTIETEKIVLF